MVCETFHNEIVRWKSSGINLEPLASMGTNAQNNYIKDQLCTESLWKWAWQWSRHKGTWQSLHSKMVSMCLSLGVLPAVEQAWQVCFDPQSHWNEPSDWLQHFPDAHVWRRMGSFQSGTSSMRSQVGLTWTVPNSINLPPGPLSTTMEWSMHFFRYYSWDNFSETLFETLLWDTFWDILFPFFLPLSLSLLLFSWNSVTSSKWIHSALFLLPSHMMLSWELHYHSLYLLVS